jgi:hypothetical protein
VLLHPANMKKYLILYVAIVTINMLSLMVLMKAFKGGEIWKILFALLGLSMMLTMTVFLFLKLRLKGN